MEFNLEDFLRTSFVSPDILDACYSESDSCFPSRSQTSFRRRKIYIYLLQRLLRENSKVLTLKQKEVVGLMLGRWKDEYICFKQIKEIYIYLGISENAFYWRLHQIKKKLGKYFNIR